jgi:hypothetical protein
MDASSAPGSVRTSCSLAAHLTDEGGAAVPGVIPSMSTLVTGRPTGNALRDPSVTVLLQHKVCPDRATVMIPRPHRCSPWPPSAAGTVATTSRSRAASRWPRPPQLAVGGRPARAIHRGFIGFDRAPAAVVRVRGDLRLYELAFDRICRPRSSPGPLNTPTRCSRATPGTERKGPCNDNQYR